MPTLPVTYRGVATLRAPDDRARIEYFDTAAPGLSLRITSDGVKTWTLVYRHRNRRRRLTLGRFPDLGLAEARKRAHHERGRISAGTDPAAEKRADRTTFRETVGALYEEYTKHAHRLRSWPEQRRIFEHEVLPAWRHRAVKEITRRDVRNLVEAKAASAPVMANRILARVSRLFSFAIERDWIDANPASRITKPGSEQSRDRVLSRDELRELWAALRETENEDADGRQVARLSPALSDVFLVMLLTGQRCGEVARMRWTDVDLRAGWWMIPSNATKNADPHRVPLTNWCLEVIARRQVSAGDDDRFVFANYRLSSVADRAKKAASVLCEGLSFSFRAHDLRRTVASYMGEAGVDRFHIAHVLNHRSVTHSTVTAIYDRYRYDKEKRAALEKWLDVLRGVVGDVLKDGSSARASSMCGAANVYEFRPRPSRHPRNGAECEGV